MGAEVAGVKHDQNKIKPRLVLNDMSQALIAVSAVATYGADKYTEGGWLRVEDAEQRYTDAMYRHMLEGAISSYDEESHILHLAHVAWNALAVLEMVLRRGKPIIEEQV